jgi:hypothetical protein
VALGKSRSTGCFMSDVIKPITSPHQPSVSIQTYSSATQPSLPAQPLAIRPDSHPFLPEQPTPAPPTLCAVQPCPAHLRPAQLEQLLAHPFGPARAGLTYSGDWCLMHGLSSCRRESLMFTRPQICREADDRQIGPGNHPAELKRAQSDRHPDTFLVAEPPTLGERNEGLRCTG